MFSRFDQSASKRHALIFLTLLSVSGFSPLDALAYSQQEFQQVITGTEARIDDIRDKEIRQLQLVLSRSARREMQPDLMLRLAELYTEKYRLYFTKENEIWSRKMDSFLQLPVSRQKVTKRPQLDNSASKQWLGKAVQILERIPLQKGRYARLEEVYYFLGFNLWELGKKKDSVKNFEKIVREFPKGRFAAEAYRYIADYAFAARDFRKSRSFYQSAARFENSPARPRVLYGLAWSHFKLRDYRRAISTMADAIRLGRAATEKGGLALQRDAADSLALFYSEGGRVDQASEYFSELFEPVEAASVLRKLANIYQRAGKYANALAINKQLMAMGGAAAREGDEQRFEIMVDGLRVATTKGDREREAALLKTMTAEFVTNAKDPQEHRVEQIQTQVKKLALLSHKEGNKSKRPRQAYERAEDLYRLYLTAFASKLKPEESAEMRYYLADVLSQLGRHAEAASEFRAIVDAAISGDSAFKKYQKDSAVGMVHSLDSYFKTKSRGKMSAGDQDQVIGAIDTYVKLYPNEKDVTKYLARAAGILVTGNRMDVARPRLHQLIEQYPSSQEAWDAAATLLKDAEDRKDYAEAERLAKLYLGIRGLMAQDKKGEFRKRLESIAARAEFEQVRQVEQSKDFNQAALGYEKLANEARDPEVRNKALNNAAVSYSRAGDKANEIRVYLKILELQPGNAQAEKAILGVGNEHFLSGRYSEAADIYELFYKAQEPRFSRLSNSSQKATVEALRSAALLRTALKQGEKASEDFRNIVEAANKGVAAARDAAGTFLFDTAERLRAENNLAEAIRSYQRYVHSFPNGTHASVALLHTGLLYGKLRELEKSQNHLRAVIAKVKAKGRQARPEELSAAAQARLELLNGLEEAYEKAPLRLPEKQLQADIKSKLQALERLNKGYIEVMDFGDGTWGVEAFRRMAMAYRNFGQKLEGAPVPEEYSPEDKAKFKAQLKNVAAPVYLKVGETLETALRKGESLQVVGPEMARVYLMTVLAAARPDRYPLVQLPDWERARDWIQGEMPDSDSELEAKRAQLRSRSDDANAWTAIGNHHLLRGETELAEIFYYQALEKSPKNVAALNNLAYLKGRGGDLTQAMAGFKTALNHDEFAIVPKKNMARLFMASGLWRHASLAYRQLEVRVPNDREVKRGLALSYLATGKLSQAESDSDLISQGEGDNGRFAEAIFALAKGDRGKAASLLGDLTGRNEFAKLILDFWNTKENN